MGKLWLIPVAVVGVAVAATGSAAAADLMSSETTQSPVSFDGVEAIELDLGAGSAVLTGTSTDGGTGSGGTVAGIRTDRSGLREPTVTEWVDGSTLHLKSRCPGWVSIRCDVHYELTVPAGVRVTGSASGGGLDLRSLAGDVDVSSSGGGIDATGTTGSLTLDSSGGGIEVTDATGPAALHSSGGGIDVTRASGALTLDSSGGGVTVIESTSAEVVAESSGGGVTVRLTRSPTSIDLDSSGGGVTLSVPDDGQAYAVDASASGGDTKVEVDTAGDSGHHIKARSSGGGVTIVYG